MVPVQDSRVLHLWPFCTTLLANSLNTPEGSMCGHLMPGQLIELLRAGTVSRGATIALLEHLLEKCPECKSRLQAILSSQGQAKSIALSISGALARVAGTTAAVERLERLAGVEAHELLQLPPEERRLRIGRSLRRFKNPLLIDRLLEESRKRLRNPFEAYELAECAQAVALRLSHSEFSPTIVMTCLARSNAYRANALRASGHFKEAEAMLTSALHLFDDEGTGDVLVQGELMEIFATLCREQRRFVEAEGYVDMAAGLYRTVEQTDLLGRVIVSKAIVLSEAGELERASEVVSEALQVVDREKDPWLFLCAAHNLVEYLLELGRFAEAREQSARNAPLWERFPDPLSQLRRQWVEGKIALGLGELDDAERILRGVRLGFANAELAFDAARVGLDLALVYLGTGRPDAIKVLAEEMLPVFMAQDIQLETTAALILFSEAVRSEQLSTGVVLELGTRLRKLAGHRHQEPT